MNKLIDGKNLAFVYEGPFMIADWGYEGKALDIVKDATNSFSDTKTDVISDLLKKLQKLGLCQDGEFTETPITMRITVELLNE